MTSTSNPIINYLQMFNRKERFYLVGYALGNTSFTLSQDFRTTVGETLGVQIPKNAFVAMDYHLDWLYASIYLSIHGNDPQVYPRKKETITANQEDIDLLIAYEEGEQTHLVLLEAKGVTPFSNAQLESKAARFNNIFSDQAIQPAPVVPHFAIISPFKPSKINTAVFPEWMKRSGALQWMELTPLKNKVTRYELAKIVRCDAHKTPAHDGTHWTVQIER